MVNVIIMDTLKLLSKTQKDKLRNKIKDYNSLELEQYSKDLLNSIYYTTDNKYNNITFDIVDDTITCNLSIIEDKRVQLKSKLKEKILEKSSTDPKWIMYRKMKTMGIPNIPTPVEVKKEINNITQQLDALKQMMPKHPLVQYFELCIRD